MEYPHRKYLTYLLTKKFSAMEITEECLRLRLLPPVEQDLNEIAASLGKFPSSWEQSYSKNNQYFCRWLRNKGVLSMWRQDPIVQECVRFMYRHSVRKDFETLVLSVPSVEAARDGLLMKYKDHLVPSVDVLTAFCDFFWDLSSISSEGLFEFLGSYHNKSANVSAVEGDIATAYAVSGIVEDVSADTFYNNLIAFANTQVSRARRCPDLMTGSSLMGIAAISRQAIEAIKERDAASEEMRVEVLDVIKEQAAAFRVRTIDDSTIQP